MKNDVIKVCLIRKNKSTKEFSVSKRKLVLSGVAIAVGTGMSVAGLNAYTASKAVIAFKCM